MLAPLEFALRALALGTGFFTILFAAAGVWAARRFRLDSLRRSAEPAASLPPVTVFKPVKGDEPGLRERLSSFLSQDYPVYQVVFSVQDPEDPALAVLESLKKEFPSADVEIVVSTRCVGANPKISNVANAYDRAEHDVLLLADSDVRVEPDFLRRLVKPLKDPAVGLVTCFERSRARGPLARRLEASYLNSQYLAQTLVAAELLGLRFALGPVMLFRRDVFESVGGFGYLSEHLADDNVLGRAVLDAGFRIEFAEFAVECDPLISTLGAHFDHMVRWDRTIRVCEPASYAGLVALQGFALLSLHMLFFGASPATLGLWLAVAAARAGSTAWIHAAYFSDPHILGELALIPLGDLVQFAAWLAGFRTGTIVWRGRRYKLTSNGRLVAALDGLPAPAGTAS